MLAEFVLVNQDLLLPIPDVRLASGEYIVGRAIDCDIPLMDTTISRHHAKLTVNSDAIQITDLGSRNKTCVGGKPIESAVARCGDDIRFGRVPFKLVLADQYQPRPEPREADTRIFRSGDQALDLESMRSQLTPAQMRVMSYVVVGHSEKEIGRRLTLSVHTVHNHIRAIYNQLKVQSRAELLSLFIAPKKSTADSVPPPPRLNAKTADDIPIIPD